MRFKLDVHLQCGDGVNRGAIVWLQQVVGARLWPGKRVSISNPNSPRDEPVACGVTPKPTTYSVCDVFLDTFKSAIVVFARGYSPQNLRKEVARRVFAPVFRALLIWMINRHFACLLRVLNNLNTELHEITTVLHLLIFSDIASHLCKKHAEVKQAKRIQTRRPCIC